jgi:hypothetical protein
MPSILSASRFRPWALAVVALLLASCASGPKLFVNEDPAADFTTYRTFAFAEPLGTDRPEYSSMLSTYLRNAARRELESRGYRYSATSPDLLVNFYVKTTEKVTSTSVPTGPAYGAGYYGYRGMNYGVWSGYETEVRQYTEGTLNVDLVDPKLRRLVWEGVAVGRVRDSARENLQQAVDDVMALVFARYPHRPQG